MSKFLLASRFETTSSGSTKLTATFDNLDLVDLSSSKGVVAGVSKAIVPRSFSSIRLVGENFELFFKAGLEDK